MKRNSQNLRGIFAVPCAIGLLSVVGLVIALAGDGWHDAVSWVSLGVPVVAVAWAMRTRRS